MSKIFKPFIKFFQLIYRIIDKIIVTPICRIIYKVSEVSKNNAGRVEKVLNRPNILIYLSLIIAIALFLLVDRQVINLKDTDAKIIENQPIEVNYNQEAYVVEGIPEGVDITLIGSKSAIYIATQLGEHNVTLDLSSYSLGTWKVPLKYNHSSSSIDYKLDPSTVTVTISEKVSEVKTLGYDLMNENKLDNKLSITDVKLDTNEIIVKSSQKILDKVAVVKALIDASQINLKESGKYTFDSVPLVAYDNQGNKLDNVEMVPTKVSATVTIDSYHVKKPVVVVTSGTMSNGKAIASLTSSVKEVDVYGEKSLVDAITSVEAVVDITNVSENTTLDNVTIVKPAGVRLMSAEKTNITIEVGNQAQRTLKGITLHQAGLSSDLSAGASNVEDKYIDVIITGVESVINNDISEENIYAYVDLTNLKSGEHSVDVIVEVSDERVTAKPVKTKINVKIKNKSS